MAEPTSPSGGPSGPEIELSTGLPMPKTINGKEVPDLFIAGQHDSWWPPKSSLTQKDVDSFTFGNSEEQKRAGVKPPKDSLKLPGRGGQPVADGPSGGPSEVTSEVSSPTTITFSSEEQRKCCVEPQLDRIEAKLDMLLRDKPWLEADPRNQA